ncbi:hypothetical protein GCM10027174_14170 [Salinifilum aidingensis]
MLAETASAADQRCVARAGRAPRQERAVSCALRRMPRGQLTPQGRDRRSGGRPVVVGAREGPAGHPASTAARPARRRGGRARGSSALLVRAVRRAARLRSAARSATGGGLLGLGTSSSSCSCGAERGEPDPVLPELLVVVGRREVSSCALVSLQPAEMRAGAEGATAGGRMR